MWLRLARPANSSGCCWNADRRGGLRSRVGTSPGRDEAAVDDEVAAGDVAGLVAGEEEDQVGDLGRLEKRPVTVAPDAWATTSSGVIPAAAETVAATPSPPSHSSVSTGPGLTVLTRMPWGPTSLDSALEKATSAALPAL